MAAKKKASKKAPAKKKAPRTKRCGVHEAMQRALRFPVIGGIDPRTECQEMGLHQKNNLQQQNKRNINADDKLKEDRRQKQVSMFEMTKLVKEPRRHKKYDPVSSDGRRARLLTAVHMALRVKPAAGRVVPDKRRKEVRGKTLVPCTSPAAAAAATRSMVDRRRGKK